MKRTPIKRGKAPRKKTSARRKKQAMDLVVKERVLERDGRQCVVDINISTGEPQVCTNYVLQAAHILPKGKYQRMRFVEENILTMCFFHHLCWQHKDPLGFSTWFNKKYPGRYERLLEMSRNAPKVIL